MNKTIVVFILSVLVILQACHSSPAPAGNGPEEVAQQATDMMEAGQNTDAINLLEKEIATRPSERARMLLASAYANRAGIRVENYWGFVVGYEKLVEYPKPFDTTTDEDNLSEVLSKISPEVKKAVKDLNVTLSNLQKIQKRLELIPAITEIQQADLLAAIDILNETSSPGGRLYRAVLEIIVLKSSTEKGLQFFFSTPQDLREACSQNFKYATDWISFTYALMQSILHDVAEAYPSQKESAERIQKEFANLMSDIVAHSGQAREALCALP